MIKKNYIRASVKIKICNIIINKSIKKKQFICDTYPTAENKGAYYLACTPVTGRPTHQSKPYHRSDKARHEIKSGPSDRHPTHQVIIFGRSFNRHQSHFLSAVSGLQPIAHSSSSSFSLNPSQGKPQPSSLSSLLSSLFSCGYGLRWVLITGFFELSMGVLGFCFSVSRSLCFQGLWCVEDVCQFLGFDCVRISNAEILFISGLYCDVSWCENLGFWLKVVLLLFGFSFPSLNG